MKNLHNQLMQEGHDSYIFWGRRHESISDHEQCCATKLGYLSHGVKARLFDRAGFYSKLDTKRLIEKLDQIDPDVVHLHNIHGYYINLEMLFGWLAGHRCQVKWTLHDCWAFTGHCAYFTYAQCEQWKSHCARVGECPQLDTYPKTYCKRNCSRNFTEKKNAFTSIPSSRMTIVTPSEWLADLVGQSFLGCYRTEVNHNEIDRGIFKPTASDFRFKHGLEEKTVVLGVASPWTLRKGLSDFLTLSQKLDGSFAVVLVGLDKKQAQSVGCDVIALPRTDSQRELAEIYTAADLFFNPTMEDNYPTVNLEAEACGTPVITYNTGGCSETISRPDSCVVSGFEEAECLIKKFVRKER
ncbi:glycosyltransferase [Paraeggerthella hongkongensis]|uniref:glycosyltransferase n=1 Tax=Paraeggerthella hominis TaxID=2897351 RepID=UPI001C121703|nr:MULTISPECIES: glycosyltransferase [Paraeggerthella]MBU5405330.1 glycosyltransferase [Paraeggerthella hongkongensis]MCD2433300.1 glycosyltransferase [Paraeggerthella hominis]